MSNNYYANGRVAVLSSKLLTVAKYNKLIECGNLTEAVKVLGELGFGDATLAGVNDYEQSLYRELGNAVNDFVELSTDSYVTRYYMAKYDYHNAKALAKSKYARLDGVPYCYSFGSITPQQMQEYINADEYGELPTFMAVALAELDEMHYAKEDSARLVDLTIDKAMFADMVYCAGKSKYRAMATIVKCEIDLVNIITMFRARQLHMSMAQCQEMLVAGGSIDMQWYFDVFQADYDKIASDVYYSPYRTLVDTCIEGRIADAEMMASAIRRRHLMGTDVDTIAPIIMYYSNKILEIDKVRYIMMCIKSGLDEETTRSRLKELYGE